MTLGPAHMVEPTRSRPHWLSALYRRLLLVRGDPAAAIGDRRQERSLRLPGDVAGDQRSNSGIGPLPWTSDLAHGIGSPRARIAIVGERAPRAQLPFRSRTGVWLWHALRELGYDELTCWVGNAFAPAGTSKRQQLGAALDALAAADRLETVLVLGRTAEREVQRAEVIPEGVAAVYADHPGAWSRFRTAEGIEGYVGHLLERGLARVGDPLWPEVNLTTGELPPTGDAEADAVPVGVAFKRGAKRRTEPGARVSRAKADKARTRYVEGEETLKAVAKALKIDYGHLGDTSRREDWPGLRHAHREELDRVRREAHMEAARSAASEQARKLSKASEVAVGALLQRVTLFAAQTGILGRDLAKPKAEVDPKTMLSGGDVRAIAEAVSLIRELQALGGAATNEGEATLGQTQRAFARLVRQHGEEAALDMLAGPEPVADDEGGGEGE